MKTKVTFGLVHKGQTQPLGYVEMEPPKAEDPCPVCDLQLGAHSEDMKKTCAEKLLTESRKTTNHKE